MEETNNSVPSAETTGAAPQTETADQATVVADNGDTESTTTYLDGKYNSVSDLEAGYTELQKSYSQKLGAFDGYDAEAGYVIPEGEMSSSDQANMEFLQSWGSENQLSNTGLNSLAAAFAEHQDGAKAAQMDAAYTELGENADRRLANVRDYLTANIGEEATKALAANMNDAASIKAIEALIGKNKTGAPAPQQQTQAITKDKLDQMRFKTNGNGDRLMSVDPSYRQQVIEAEAKLLGGGSRYTID